MKVLNLSNQYPTEKFPYKGSFIYNLLHEIARDDEVEVHVLTPNYQRGADLTSRTEGNVEVHFFDPHVYPEQDPLLTRIFPGIGGKFKMLRFLNSFVRRARQLKGEHDYDLVHTHWLIPSGLVGRFLRLPQVNTSYGSDIMILPDKRLWRPVIRRILKGTSFQFAIGEEIHRRSQELVSGDGEVTMPVPVSKEQYDALMSTGLDKHEKNPTELVMVASLYPLKNTKSLLKAINIGDDVRLHIVGDGDERDMLETMASNLPDNVEVIFHGFQSRENTLRIISEAHISVLPSYSEGISSFLVESMYAGNVIIASNVGGTPSIVRDHGLLHHPDDVKQLREHIQNMVRSPRKRMEYAERARSFASVHLNPQKIAQRHIEVYKEVLSRSVPR